MEESKHLLDISWETILKVALAALLFYLLYLVRNIVIWFFFGLIISVLLDPAIRFLNWIRIPRALAVCIIYLSIFGVLGSIIYLSAPIFIDEIKEFSKALPDYFDKIGPIFKELNVQTLQNAESVTQSITGGLEAISASIFNALSIFFGGITSTLFILSVAFFLSLEENAFKKVITLISPKRYEEYVLALFERCETKVSGWFGARILSCLFIGVASFIAFFVMHVKYSSILALLAGVSNFIPFLGPVVMGLLLIIFVGVADSWVKALIVLVAFILIQEFENHILSPILNKRFVGLPPVLVLISLVVGGVIFGFLGTIFAIPLFGILYEFIKEFLEKRKEERNLKEVDIAI